MGLIVRGARPSEGRGISDKSPLAFRSGPCQTGREARAWDGIRSQAEAGLLVSPGVGEAEGSVRAQWGQPPLTPTSATFSVLLF